MNMVLFVPYSNLIASVLMNSISLFNSSLVILKSFIFMTAGFVRLYIIICLNIMSFRRFAPPLILKKKRKKRKKKKKECLSFWERKNGDKIFDKKILPHTINGKGWEL